MVKLDLNYPDFQKEWFKLGKEDFLATQKSLKKILAMTWPQVDHDRGLKWEKNPFHGHAKRPRPVFHPVKRQIQGRGLSGKRLYGVHFPSSRP